jgi:hypothetical protein
MKNIYLVLGLISTIGCNMWDNLLSQLKSPQFTIPNEVKLELSNDNKIIMEIAISTSYNMIKISLTNEELSKEMFNLDRIVDIYLNFTNGTVDFDFDDSCFYKNITALKSINTKFIIYSYDWLTYFNNLDEKYFDYILTNPLSGKFDAGINYFLFAKKNLKGGNSDILNNIKNQIGNIIDKDSYINFRVNKSTKLLEKISLKYDKVILNNLDVKSTAVNKFDDDVFKLKHDCALLEEKDKLFNKL